MTDRGGRKARVGAVVVLWLLALSDLEAGPADPAQVWRVTDGFLKTKAAESVAAAAGGSGAVPAGPQPGTSSITVQGMAERPTPGGLRELRDDDNTLLAYIADLEPRGFVVLSADTDLDPIIAYSFHSDFPGAQDREHPLLRMVRADLRLRAGGLAEHPERRTAEPGKLWALYADGPLAAGPPDVSAGALTGTVQAMAFQQWPPEGSTATGGWLRTAWDQDPPYNQLCPADTVDGGRSYVGCAATALAQILNYHRQCQVVFGPEDAYTMSSGLRVDADCNLYDFPSFTDLNGYLDAVRSVYAAGGDLNEVQAAALSFACGVAVQMDYSSEGSGASPYATQDALLKKFGFFSADMFGGPAADALLALQENVINGLPALIGIRPTDGFGGHAVVCDGYNTDGEYHCNYGWGSPYPEEMTEVWYRFPTRLYPDEYVITESVLNIRPTEPPLQTEPASLSFYGAPGQESDPQILRLHSRVAGVQVSSISSPEGFVVGLADDFADPIGPLALSEPNQEVSLRVQFRPQQAGGYYGTLAIRYNADSVRYVVLRGWSFDGGTQVPAGDVSGTWSPDRSPYFVNGSIQVRANDELVVEPGVQVFFTGPYGLTAGSKAKLTARGDAAHPIEFTAWNREAGWGGLRFVNSGSDDVLSFCSVTWAKKTVGVIPTDLSGDSGPSMADSYGGALYCSGSDPTIENCRITNNLGDGAGGIYCVDSSPVISNTLIANNTSLGGAPRCGGLSAYAAGAPELRNCTIVHNSPGGISAESWDGLAGTNTIVWGNEVYQIETDQSVPVVTFCDVQGGYPGVGNRSEDPGFLNPSPRAGIEYDGAAANWALQSVSPCINAGTAIADLPAVDLAGAPRMAAGVIDLGACENQAELPLLTVLPSVTADAGFAQLDTAASVHLDLTNTGARDFEIQSLNVTEGDRVFSVLTQVVGRTLAPGESVPVEIAFQPTREAVYRGQLDLRSTASNAGHVRIALKGVGVKGTIVPAGAVSGVWTAAGGPYVVTGDIQVPRGQTLTIEPGITVKFAGHFGLTVGYRATLLAVGAAQDPIVFTAIDKQEGWYGIRLINAGSDDVLQYCTLEFAKKPYTGGGSVSGLYGGAILCMASWEDEPGYGLVCSPWIDSCRLAHNHAYVGGAMACLEGADALITHNTILDNTADYYGAGIALYYAGTAIANNVIVRNEAGVDGGGIQVVVSGPAITNNTMVANRPSALQLESVQDEYGDMGPALVMNNIIWANEIRQADAVTAGEYQIQFNDVQGGWEGTGNLDQDPLFADPDADDYHLKSAAGRWDPTAGAWVVDPVTSPCIDAGNPASSVGQEPQPNGQRANLGAYGRTDQASKSPGS